MFLSMVSNLMQKNFWIKFGSNIVDTELLYFSGNFIRWARDLRNYFNADLNDKTDCERNILQFY